MLFKVEYLKKVQNRVCITFLLKKKARLAMIIGIFSINSNISNDPVFQLSSPFFHVFNI
jgi:hypothetical protein